VKALLMSNCNAPWYELNISAPDNIASACCYYSGEKEHWGDQNEELATYWNGPGIRRIRRIQTGRLQPHEVNGCANCFYFANRVSGAEYFHFDKKLLPDGLSEHQLRNFWLAKEEFAAEAEFLRCTPLRLYMNFGFACNLACTMCHQVPRRKENRRQVLADTILSWHEALRSAIDVTVIGGEPFALPEAIKFIRGFIAHPDYDTVPLTICTNGTVHHKHWNTLRQKRKLNFAISLDSIGSGYESIRVGSKWDLVERNVLMVQQAIKTDRPEWSLQTNGLLLKTGVPYLPRFAEWHANHGIVTSFYDFINSRGTEDAFFSENMLHNPQILDDMPDWEQHFHEAVAIFRGAGLEYAATSLDHYRERVAAARAAKSDCIEAARRMRMRNDWAPLFHFETTANSAVALLFSPGPHAGPPPIDREHDPIIFKETRSGDHFATDLLPVKVPDGEGRVRLRALWPSKLNIRHAHIIIQRETLAELDCFREYHETMFYHETVLTASLPSDVQALRAVFLPVGEDASALPQRLTLETDLGTQHIRPVVGAVEHESAGALEPAQTAPPSPVAQAEDLPRLVLEGKGDHPRSKRAVWQFLSRALPRSLRSQFSEDADAPSSE
jgi:hypothetical protein